MARHRSTSTHRQPGTRLERRLRIACHGLTGQTRLRRMTYLLLNPEVLRLELRWIMIKSGKLKLEAES